MNILKFLIGALLIIGLMFGFGYAKSASDLKSGLSRYQSVITISSMNFISAEGYKFYLRNSSTWQYFLNKTK